MRFLKNYIRAIPWIMTIFTVILALYVVTIAELPLWGTLIVITVGPAFAWFSSRLMMKLFSSISGLFIPIQLTGQKPSQFQPGPVKYALNPEDFKSFYQQQMRSFRFLALGSSVLWVWLLITSIQNNNVFWISLSLIFVLWGPMILLYYGSNLQLKRLMNKHTWKEQLGWHELKVVPDGVIDSGDFGVRQRDWESVALMKPTQDYFVMGVRKPYLRAVPFFVPRRAFPDDQCFRDFIEAAKNFQNIALSR